MKYFYLLIAIACCNISQSQDTRLFENYWYLRKVTVDAIDHVPPTTMGVEFQDTAMMAMGCLPLTAFVSFEANLTNFSATNFSPCLCLCTDSEAQSYEPIYFSFFMGEDYDLTSTKFFTYSISEAGNERTLVITSIDNKQATFSSVMLSRVDFSGSSFSIYPNPSADKIYINAGYENLGRTSVTFYNELGKICKLVELSESDKTIDISAIKAGIYFLKIENNAAIYTKKFVKM